MSVDTKLGDLSKNQIALIVVLVAISILFVTYGVAVYLGFSNNPTGITIGGEINFSEIQTLVLVIVSGGLVLLGITVGNNQARAAIKENDNTWLSESLTVNPPRTDGKRTAYEMPDLYKAMMFWGAYVRKIYESDAELTPAEQQEAIKILPGLSAAEMEALIPLTGPTLADSIRELISKHRATNRTDKDKHS